MRSISNMFRTTVSKRISAAHEVSKGSDHNRRVRRGAFDGDARQKDRLLLKPCGATMNTFGCSTVL